MDVYIFYSIHKRIFLKNERKLWTRRVWIDQKECVIYFIADRKGCKTQQWSSLLTVQEKFFSLFIWFHPASEFKSNNIPSPALIDKEKKAKAIKLKINLKFPQHKLQLKDPNNAI